MKQELSQHKKSFENELQNNILPYWIKYGAEKEGDGFYPAVDLLNNPVLTANKTSVLNARILWTFSLAAVKYPEKNYETIAHRAFNVISNHFHDNENGGYFMELSAENRVVNDIKHTYSQAFVLYSLCKYYEFNPGEVLLETIKQLYYLLEQRAKDPAYPGYIESFTRNWEIYSENRMADNNEPRTMNTHLHILEAYAALCKIWDSPEVKASLAGLLNLFIDKIIRTNGHLGIFFSINFDEGKDSTAICSFGHDIEASWLLWEAAEILGNEQIKAKLKPIVINMAKRFARVAVDTDGGVFLESMRFGSHVRTNKHWWIQAEALVGFMNAFELTGDIAYWEMVKKTWTFIDSYLIDHKNGEWFTKLNRLGEPYLTEPDGDPSPYYRNDWKIDPWKCPYHNGRAMIEMTDRIARMHMQCN